MSQFWLYFQLGLDHVLDWRAYDHAFHNCTVYSLRFLALETASLPCFHVYTGAYLSLFVTHYELVSVSKAGSIPHSHYHYGSGHLQHRHWLENRLKDKVEVLFLVTLFWNHPWIGLWDRFQPND